MGLAGKAGDWERVQRLHGAMRAARIQPDVWTYASLAAACAACGNRWQEALAFEEDMRAAGVGSCRMIRYLMIHDPEILPNVPNVKRAICRPPAHVCSASCIKYMLRTCDVYHKHDQLFACEQECLLALPRVGVLPAGIAGNVVLLTTLMHVCQRGGQPAKATRIFRAAEAAGLQLDVVRAILGSLVCSLASGGVAGHCQACPAQLLHAKAARTAPDSHCQAS